MGSAPERSLVEVMISALNQPGCWVGAIRESEAVQLCQCAAGSDFEDRPSSATRVRCPVEVPIGGLTQPRGRVGPIRPPKAVQRRQRAAKGDSEYLSLI